VGVITLLVVEISLLPGVLYLFGNGPSLCPDVIEVEMFAFLALTLEMIQTGVQDEMEQLRCPFREQAVVHLRSYHIHRFLQFTDNGRNGVDRMDESHERQWTI